MGFEETNTIINDRIHDIASRFNTGNISEREKNELATLIYPKLKYYIWKFCNNQDDTEEALQWTLKKIFNNISKFDFNKGRFTTWIYKIARNETLFYLHKKNQHRSKFSDLEYDNSCDDSGDIFNETESELQKIYDETISQIYSMQDTLLKNIAIDKMIKNDKVKTIATRYDINENTVKTKLRKIRSDLRDKVLEKNPCFRENLNHIFKI